MRQWPGRHECASVTWSVDGAGMSAAETVTVVVDGREIQVPKGTGLVETALAAGIEIPVFCYEPRLGPPVGACRMCLVEVEGMPKLQAGCTLTATDGMVVKTAQTSQLAADGQNSTLEFILVNHPLDCPVCDKGGECPLQDLTFRWGPPVTRNTFPKRTFEKPIPISPTIALDRERCILCYRCTRFSSDVAEDSQLVARDRGAQSVIATFEDEPYSAPFSGNVIELCPVGALTSTQYRFEARPWEIQDVPTVCGLCPVGCNVDATTREGKVKRVVSRNHPEVDEGWLCDKGRFGFTHLRAGDRVVDPGRKVGVRALRDALLGRSARRGRGAAARGGEEHRHRALRLGDGRAGLRARQAAPRRARRPLRGHARGRQPRARRVPPAAVRDPRRGADRDPRRRPRRRARADRRPLGQGRAPRGRRGRRERDRRRRRGRGQGPERARRQDPLDRADDPHLVGPERERRRARRSPRRRARPRRQARQRRVPPPGDRERPRGRRRLGGRGRRRGGRPGADRAPDRLGRRSGGEPGRPRPRRPSRACPGDLDVPLARRGWSRPRPPRNELPRARRDVRQPRGPAPAPAPRRDPALPGRAGLDRQARRALRRRGLAVPAAGVRRALGALLRGHRLLRRSESAPHCRSATEAIEVPEAPPAETNGDGKGLRLVSYRPLFSGPAIDRIPELQFQRPDPEIELAPSDATRLGVEPGSTVTSARTAPRSTFARA